MENEKRLIDAYKLEDLVQSNSARYHHVDDIIAAIAGQPTVDAVEVVHGRWKKNWHDNNLIGHEYEECSVCGSCIISDTEKFWDCNYCPNCGAKMDGERKDNGTTKD